MTKTFQVNLEVEEIGRAQDRMHNVPNVYAGMGRVYGVSVSGGSIPFQAWLSKMDDATFGDRGQRIDWHHAMSGTPQIKNASCG